MTTVDRLNELSRLFLEARTRRIPSVTVRKECP